MRTMSNALDDIVREGLSEIGAGSKGTEQPVSV